MPRTIPVAVLFAALVAAFTGPTAVAQRADPRLPPPRTTASGVFDDYTLEVGGSRSALRLESAPQNQVSGRVDNDRLSGLYAPGPRRLVLVRWRDSGFGPKPIEAYVGRYAAGQRAQSGVIDGVAYGLNASGGATPQRNARGFRAWQRHALLPHLPPPPLVDPPPGSASLPSADGAWWVRAGDAESALVLDVAPSGDANGWILGDPLLGHYAAETGAIAFLRSRHGTPIQLFQGTASASPPGVELRGRFYALNAEGGAGSNEDGWEFRAANRWNFRTYRAWDVPLCLSVAGAHDGAPLVLQPCAAVEDQQIAPVMMFNNDVVMVVRRSGRCLDVANASPTPGAPVQQYACHGGANQRIIFQGAVDGFQLRFGRSGSCMTFDALAANAAVRQRRCDEPGARNQFVR